MRGMRLGEGMRLTGAFAGGTREKRWFSIPLPREGESKPRPASRLLPAFLAAYRPAGRSRGGGMAGVFLF